MEGVEKEEGAEGRKDRERRPRGLLFVFLLFLVIHHGSEEVSDVYFSEVFFCPKGNLYRVV